jgi:hypothetical protein
MSERLPWTCVLNVSASFAFGNKMKVICDRSGVFGVYLIILMLSAALQSLKTAAV